MSVALKQAVSTSLSSSETPMTLSLDTLLNAIPCGVVLLSAKGTVMGHNQLAAKLLSVKLLNRSWISIVSDAVDPKVDDGFEVSLKNGKRVRVATQSLSDLGGQLVVIDDLTQTRALQDLAHEQKNLLELGTLSAELAHQIRTPISTALLYNKKLCDQDLPENTRIDFAKKATKVLKKLESYVGDMLSYARSGSAAREEVTIERLVNELYFAIEPLMSKHNVSLTVINLANEEAKISANLNMLLGSLINLTTNAIDAMANNERKEITIELRDHSSEVILLIKDNGSGMSKDTLESANHAFFTTKETGNGLGLSVVDKVIKSLSGRLVLKSDEGTGTTVEITLPTLDKK